MLLVHVIQRHRQGEERRTNNFAVVAEQFPELTARHHCESRVVISSILPSSFACFANIGQVPQRVGFCTFDRFATSTLWRVIVREISDVHGVILLLAGLPTHGSRGLALDLQMARHALNGCLKVRRQCLPRNTSYLGMHKGEAESTRSLTPDPCSLEAGIWLSAGKAVARNRGRCRSDVA